MFWGEECWRDVWQRGEGDEVKNTDDQSVLVS